jgi:hypothetical protein
MQRNKNKNESKMNSDQYELISWMGDGEAGMRGAAGLRITYFRA